MNVQAVQDQMKKDQERTSTSKVKGQKQIQSSSLVVAPQAPFLILTLQEYRSMMISGILHF